MSLGSSCLEHRPLLCRLCEVALRTTTLKPYLLALAAALVAAFVRWALDPWLHDQLRYAPLIGAVVWVVYYAGYRPAILAAVVGFMAATLLQPDGLGTLEDPSTLVAFALYCITCGLIIFLGESQRRARIRVDASRELQHVTFASIGDAVITTDTKGCVTYLNPVAESLTGWSLDEVRGRPLSSIFRILNEETRDVVESPVERVLRAGIIVGLANHTVLVAKDGTERPIDDSAAPIRDKEGRLIGVVMVFRDVTERRQLENMRRDLQYYLEQQIEERTAELRSSEERFRLLVEGTRDVAIFMIDPMGRIVSWNAGAGRIKGYRSAEIIGHHFSLFYLPEDVAAQKPDRELEIAAREGKYEEEGWRLRKDGTRFWASVVITALRDESGSLRGYSKVTRDFTEKMAAEESARMLLQEETARRSAELYAREVEEERERLRVTLTSIGDAVIATDQEGRVELLNPIAEALTGWRNTEAMGRPLRDVFRIINEFTRRPVEDPVAKVLATGKIMGLANHTILLSRDGTEHPIDDSAAPILDADGNILGVVLVFRDISEAKRAEQTSRRLALIVESSQDAIIAKDTEGIVTSWNRGAEQLYGYVAEEMIGQSISRIVPADRLVEFSDIMERIRRGQRIEPYETVRVRKDGRHIEVAVTISPLEDEHGTIIGASAIARDITDRKRTEESLREGAERLRVALLALKEADRRKDEFLATLAHELRNPLAPIRNAVEVLKEANDDPNLRWSRDVIERQVRHMSRLLEDLLDVSRISHNKLELRRERTVLAEVIQSAVETSRPIIDSGRHTLHLEVSGHSIFVDVDPVRMAQVFSNLLNNAAKYTPPGGHIHLSVVRQGSEVAISVKDDGIGIAPEMMPHIFDIFAQGQRATDGAQGGLGIGLSLSRGVVELHGGRIEARSEGRGRGSEFIVSLPLVSAPVASRAPRPSPGVKQATIKRRLLIVDDLKDGADSLAMMLRLMGHEVETAYDGEDGVAVAARFRPEMALLDIGMPKMNGYEAARKIRREPWGRNIFLVALTGWGQEDDRNRTQEAGFDHHIVKPADPADLSALLERLPTNREAPAASEG